MKLDEMRRLAHLEWPESAAQQQLFLDRMRAMGLEPGMLYQELEMSSPYVDTHRDVSFSNAHIQLHSHTFYELLYCSNSCGAEYLVGSERFRLQRGDLIFVPPGISHRPLLPEQMAEPYTRYVLWLSQEFMDRYAALFPYPFTDKQHRASMLRTAGTPWEDLGELFRAGVREAEQRRDGWQAAVIGNTMVLLTQIKRATDQPSARALTAEKPELLDRIMAYVEENFSRNFTIAELAAHFFVSSSTVSHLFRQKLGVSFGRYVTQRRLIAAKTMIGQGMLLEDVSIRSGFGDYSVFYRAFKQEFGISPRQYRSLQEGNGRTQN